MSATAIQPSKSSEGAGVVDGVINWGRETAADLWQSFIDLVGGEAIKPAVAIAHRWRYALAEAVYAEHYLIDPERQLAACGDWCGGPRVEGAFLSGLETAEQLARLR